VGGAMPSASPFLAAPGRLPHGTRVYAVGDVHGCLAELRAMHQAIGDDLAARPPAAAILIYLGDLIDHGPDSAGVVALLAAGPPLAGVATVTLRGDHEQMLLDALAGDAAAATDWLAEGGEAALKSWGLSARMPRADWPDRLPAEAVAFLRDLPLSHREGTYLFAHAGIRPGVPLAQQAPGDLRGIRQPFLVSEQDFGVVVVHGHSVVPDPVVRAPTGSRSTLAPASAAD
ncbi:MAG: metallophosphoesterase, partial [Pseudomonadota bacterium]|nr:metallophosphoesterase [Pseudomonadota bacterium]